jgi:glucose-6-phosphate 1-dehydrogenase
MMHVEASRNTRVGSSGPLRRMLIIGGTSDLSRRHLLPALTRLMGNGELPEAFTVTVTGLEPMPREEGRGFVARELAEHAGDLPADARQALAERVSYLQADVRNTDALRGLTAAEPLLIYIATPPAAVPAALEAVREANLNRPARIVLDKPFGLTRKSAQALNAQVLELVEEHNVYRIDHFLYHHVVQELVRWRVQSDPLALADLMPLAEAEIVWDETRVAQSSNLPYCGVVRDMIQSHLLQLAAVITMDPPEAVTRDALTRCRLDALRHMSAVAASCPLRARLSRACETTAPSGEPETFAVLGLHTGMPRWKDVHILLRAAKGLHESRRHIELRSARHPDQHPALFVRLEVLAGKLTIGSLKGKAPLEFPISADAESASTRLLRAALAGDDTFTLSSEEPLEAWRIVEPVLQAWAKSNRPIPTYGIGTTAESVLRASAELPDA